MTDNRVPTGDMIKKFLTVNVPFNIKLCTPEFLKAQDAKTAKAVAEEIRKAVAIKFQEALSEAKEEPFPSDRLNKEHKIFWTGEANAFSEIMSYIDNKYGGGATSGKG